jgi:DNA/RNA endonuclease G (NUC1)
VDPNNTLFSILMLPALLILRDAHIILEPFTIKTIITDSEVSVTRGLLTRTTDKLSIKTLENIEIVKSPMARIPSRFWKSYGTLNLYAYGGTVIMPNLKKPEAIQKEIEAILGKLCNQV